MKAADGATFSSVRSGAESPAMRCPLRFVAVAILLAAGAACSNGQPAFARPVAWAFTPLHRHVQFSQDRAFIWFDEQVRSSMGILQASGVIRPAADRFEMVHYQLSIAVPNDVIPQVTATIKAFESK